MGWWLTGFETVHDRLMSFSFLVQRSSQLSQHSFCRHCSRHNAAKDGGGCPWSQSLCQCFGFDCDGSELSTRSTLFQVVGVGVAAIWTVPEVAVLLFCFSFSFLAHVLQSSRLARPMRCDFPLKMRANSPKFFRVISISTLLQKLGFRRSREVVPSGANRVVETRRPSFRSRILGGKWPCT